MKQSLARSLIIFSLILSLISFILSLIVFFSPNWKYIQLRSTSLSIISSKFNQIDPLIRNELEKYYDLLYHRGNFCFNLI